MFLKKHQGNWRSLFILLRLCCLNTYFCSIPTTDGISRSLWVWLVEGKQGESEIAWVHRDRKRVGGKDGKTDWRGGGQERKRERLHSALTAHIVSLWSQLGSDWWHNYNMDMRYLHKAATIIHSHILFTEHMTPEHFIKHVVGTRLLWRATSCVHFITLVEFVLCTVYTHEISTWTVSYRFHWETGISMTTGVLWENMEGCCLSLVFMFSRQPSLCFEGTHRYLFF